MARPPPQCHGPPHVGRRERSAERQGTVPRASARGGDVTARTLLRTFGPVATLRRQAGAVAERRLTLLAPSRRLRFARALAELERLPADRAINVLDAGCGDGLFSHEVARRRP